MDISFKRTKMKQITSVKYINYIKKTITDTNTATKKYLKWINGLQRRWSPCATYTN